MQADAGRDSSVDAEALQDGASMSDATETVDADLDAFASPDAGTTTWRSSLYPEDWAPDFSDSEGRFLHDFSYAGYRNGEAEPAVPAEAHVVNLVDDCDVDSTGATDVTNAVQDAIDALPSGGGVVYFPPGLYRFDGTLSIHQSNVVLRGAGADLSRVYFTSSIGMSNGAHIHVSGAVVADLEVSLAVDGSSRANFVDVADAGSLAPGDDIAVGWVISEAFIAEHGMAGVWSAFNGQWRPFFRRQVVSIDRDRTPQRIFLDVPLRYPAKVRDLASVRRESGYLREVGVESLGISNVVAVADAWSQNLVRAIQFTGVADGWVSAVESFASPLAPTSGGYAGYHLQSQGISIQGSKRVSVTDCVLGFAENRGGGGNGYLYEVMESNEVLFRDDVGVLGRHNFIENFGFGTTGCVWLRVHSSDGRCDLSAEWGDLGIAGVCASEFHHSLATANLIDSSTLDDGWKALNRYTESTGAGQTGTENVFWNTRGGGTLVSMQYGLGYVIGTEGVTVQTTGTLATYPHAYMGTEPEDFTEGLEAGAELMPQSLYENQRARRLGL